MQVDDRYVYVFVRQDLSVAQQLVQLGHVMRRRGMLSIQEEGIPSLVVIGMPHEESMERVLTKLAGANIGFNTFTDPDQKQLGMTAISTRPVSVTEKEVLRNYRMWNPLNNQINDGVHRPKDCPHCNEISPVVKTFAEAGDPVAKKMLEDEVTLY